MVELGRSVGQENFVRNPVVEHRTEVVRGMNGFVKEKLKLFSSPERVWQPSDFYPDEGQFQDRKTQAAGLSDDLLVVIAAALVTENALPTYQTWINRIPGVKDETGIDDIPWAIGNRFWTADESRHPTAIRDYMNHSGRFDMRKVEVTSQHLIRSGFNPKIGKDPYMAVGYVSIQEPKTQISHTNTGLIAGRQGDPDASNMFLKLGGDEGRHTGYYQPIYAEIVRLDPNGATIALRDVLEQEIDRYMPGMLMTHDGVVPASGKPSPLYEQLSSASIHSGIYTPQDHMRTVADFIKMCRIENLPVSGEGAKAQEKLGKRLRVYERMLDRSTLTPKQTSPATNLVYSWLK